MGNKAYYDCTFRWFNAPGAACVAGGRPCRFATDCPGTICTSSGEMNGTCRRMTPRAITAWPMIPCCLWRPFLWKTSTGCLPKNRTPPWPPKNMSRNCRPFLNWKPVNCRGLTVFCWEWVRDGHTASLFPGTDALHETKRLVAANWVEKIKTYRITLTVPVLNHADLVVFLVSGAEKAEALKEVLQGEYRPERFPAQLIRPGPGKLLWIVDRAAASLLTNSIKIHC